MCDASHAKPGCDFKFPCCCMQVAAVRAERDQEVRALAGKLEAVTIASNRSIAEAERIIEAKEGLLAQWKEETQTVRLQVPCAACNVVTANINS